MLVQVEVIKLDLVAQPTCQSFQVQHGVDFD